MTDQPDDHARFLKVNVEEMIFVAGKLTYCVHKPSSGHERLGAEARALSFTEHAPVLDAVALPELRAGDLLSRISS